MHYRQVKFVNTAEYMCNKYATQTYSVLEQHICYKTQSMQMSAALVIACDRDTKSRRMTTAQWISHVFLMAINEVVYCLVFDFPVRPFFLYTYLCVGDDRHS